MTRGIESLTSVSVLGESLINPCYPFDASFHQRDYLGEW